VLSSQGCMAKLTANLVTGSATTIIQA